MYEDKTLVCKECGKEFVFTAGEQEFYVTLARTPPVAPVSTSPLPAQPAAARRRFPLNPRPTVPCIAAIASLRCVRTADQPD